MITPISEIKKITEQYTYTYEEAENTLNKLILEQAKNGSNELASVFMQKDSKLSDRARGSILIYLEELRSNFEKNGYVWKKRDGGWREEFWISWE